MSAAFANQVAVITGAGKGLGRALARKLVAEGCTVVLFDLAGPLLEDAQAEFGSHVICRQVDVTDEARIRTAVAEIETLAGQIDILVNCAGVVGKANVPSYEVELADFERVMRINLYGAFVTSSAVLPGMIRRKYGRILHVASISGKEGNPGMTAYSTSKAALIGLTKVQGKECATSGVTVNAIAPALLDTDLYQAMPRPLAQALEDKIPMRRVGTQEEFAAMAAFIVSPAASYTTGFAFDLSGGRATY